MPALMHPQSAPAQRSLCRRINRRRTVEIDVPAEPAGDRPEVNRALIARVRDEIHRGEYDTDHRWDIAVSRLIAAARAQCE